MPCLEWGHASAARVDGDEGPHVLGHGVGLFTAGEVIAEENFETLENWVVQQEGRSGGRSGEDWR